MSGTVVLELLPDLPSYTADQEVTVRATFRDTAGALTDAGDVAITMIRPDGAQTEYTFLGGDLTHPSTGIYERSATMTMPNDWTFHAQGSTLVAADELTVTVDDSAMFDDDPPLPPAGAGNDGKIARVTGGAYQPYGGAADEQPLIWRVGTGWVSQALNLAAAAAVSGLLAISHIAPGSNGQILQTVGGATTWVTPSAASLAGGSNTQVQYNNAGNLDGTSNITVAGAGCTEYGFSFLDNSGFGGAVATNAVLNFKANVTM